MNLFDLMAKISLDTSEYEAGLDSSEKKGRSFAQSLGGGLKTAAKVGAVAIGAVTTGAVALGTAVVKGTSNLAAYGDNVDKMSQKMGLSARAYQEWDAVMQHSGTSMETMKASMKTLANAAETGNEAFQRLGLSLEQVGSMSQEELFEATIAGLQNVTDTTERTYLAGKLLGRGATELGALLNTSAEDTQAMRDRVHELGGVMSDEAVKAAAAYQDTLQDMNTSIDGLKRGIMTNFLPGITSVMDGLTDIFSGDSGSGTQKITQGISDMIKKISEGMPQVIKVGGDIMKGLFGAISENLPTIMQQGTEIIIMIATGIIENLPQLAKSGVEIILQLASAIASTIPTLIPTIVEVVLSIVDTLIENAPQLATSAVEIMVALAGGIISALPQLIAKAPEIIVALVNALIEAAPMLLNAGMELLNHIVTGFASVSSSLLNAGKNLISGLLNTLSNMTANFGVVGRNIINSIKNAVSTTFGTLSSLVSSKFNSLKTTMVDAFESAKAKIDTVVSKLKNVFNFSWSLPHIKTPHFSVGAGPTVLGVQLPTISVKWYKKAYEEPYLFDRPTVVGNMGFGDGNGAEMVYGRDQLMRDIKQAFSEVTGAGGTNRPILLYLDGDKLVGGTSDRMDESLGQMQVYQLRWEGV